MPDRFTWAVLYQDGTIFHEIDDAGHPHGWAEVDASRAMLLLWYDREADTPHAVVSLPDYPTTRPILFRRRVIAVNPETGQELAPRATISVIGWQATIAGRNVKSLLALYDDGRILLTSNDEDIDAIPDQSDSGGS